MSRNIKEEKTSNRLKICGISEGENKNGRRMDQSERKLFLN